MKRSIVYVVLVVAGFVLGGISVGSYVWIRTRDPKGSLVLQVYRKNTWNLNNNQSRMNKQLIEYIKGQNYYLAQWMGTDWAKGYGAKDYGRIDEQSLNGVGPWKGNYDADLLYRDYKDAIE